MGYGSANFTKSLVETYRRLAEKDVRDEDFQQVRRFGEQVRSHPIHLLNGVSETLDYLSARHDLFLLTKGDLEEQQFKVEQSRVERLFKQVLVLNAVYIPHPHTWHFEHEEVLPAGEGQLLELSSFAELRNHF